MLRVLALWHNSKMLSTILHILIICEAVSKTALSFAANIVDEPQSFVLARGVALCGTLDYQLKHALSLQLVDWVINASVGFVLLVLALYKAIDHWKLSGIKKSSLINIMIEDQITYYILVLFCSAMNFANERVRSTELSVRNSIFSLIGNPGLLCLLGSRMFLNLKEVAEPCVVDESSNPNHSASAGTISNPRFAEASGSSFSI